MKYIKDIIGGLLYVHNSNVIHRDLKPANIFISDEHLVIGDFGLAVSANSATQFYGTPNYVAPELWSDRNMVKRYTQSTDLFAAGCIFYEICTLEMAFPDRDRATVCNKILNGKYKPIADPEYPEGLKNFIYSLITPNPIYRQSTQEIKRYIEEKNLLSNPYVPPMVQPQIISAPQNYTVSTAPPSIAQMQSQQASAIMPSQSPPVSTNKYMSISSQQQKVYSQNQNVMMNSSINFNSPSQYNSSGYYQNPSSTPYPLSHPNINYQMPSSQQPSISQQPPLSQPYPQQQYPPAYPLQQLPSQPPVLSPPVAYQQPIPPQSPRQFVPSQNGLVEEENDEPDYIVSSVRMNNHGDLFIITDILR